MANPNDIPSTTANASNVQSPMANSLQPDDACNKTPTTKADSLKKWADLPHAVTPVFASGVYNDPHTDYNQECNRIIVSLLNLWRSYTGSNLPISASTT